VTIAFGAYAVRGVDLGEMRDAITRAEDRWLVASLAVLVLAIALRALRWQYLFPARNRPGYRAVSTALLIGYFFNSVLPARAGEAARVVAIGRLEPVSRMTAAGTVVVERVYDFLVVGLLLLILVPWLPRVTWLPQTLSFLAALVIVIAGVVIVLRRLGDRPARLLLSPLQKFSLVSAPRLDLAATNLTAAFTTARTPRPAALGLAVGLASWLLFGFSFWLVMRAFDLGLPFGAGLLVAIATALGAVIPSGPAGLGVFEAATVVALSAYGVSGTEALTYAVVLHALNFFPFLLAGGIALLLSTRPA
jgi:glycosyltransferase 2 family protein